MAFSLEYTDTFSGQPNYSWVTRMPLPDDDELSDNEIRWCALCNVGLDAVEGVWDTSGSDWSFTPNDRPTILFVIWEDA